MGVDKDRSSASVSMVATVTIFGETETLAIRGVEDLLGVVPHLLGFHPEESLVALLLDQGAVALTARVDLAQIALPGEAAEHLSRLQSRFPKAMVCLIAYSDDPVLGWDVLRECDLTAGLAASCTLLVSGDRWFADPAGPAQPYDPRSSVAAAEATLRGMTARPSRAHLAALVQGPEDPAAFEQVFEEQRRWLAALLDPGMDRAFLVRLLAEVRARPSSITDEECARLALMVRWCEPRDQASLMLCRETAPDLLAVWATVVARTPPSDAVQPLGLMGMAAWVAGDGALSMCCLERAEALARPTGLMSILANSNRLMLPPAYWDDVLRPGLLAAEPLVRPLSKRAYRRMCQRRT